MDTLANPGLGIILIRTWFGNKTIVQPSLKSLLTNWALTRAIRGPTTAPVKSAVILQPHGGAGREEQRACQDPGGTHEGTWSFFALPLIIYTAWPILARL